MDPATIRAAAIALLAAACAPAAEPARNITIEVPDGFTVERIASAPLVRFPMLGGFDERGRLFLAENAGVNLDEKALAEQLPSRITMLEDVDGDGVFDRASTFADRLAFPQGALWYDGALYVTSAPSVWRLTDTDGDGRADARTEIATGFKSTGNAADVHGPFLHPNGRLYWCHGRKGHEVYQNSGGTLVSRGLGARIWSARPDGTDIQVHAGGGMDNPVEVTFSQEGEIFGTANIFQGSPRSDALVHWVHGGVYPRADQEPVLAEFCRTGELLPPVTLLGHVAPAGVVLPRSDTWGAGYRHNVFLAEFNTHRIMRVPLERSGASYRGRPEVFARATDPNVHFTGVIEDADGSLVVIDTGAWFRRGCPTSVVARADLLGAVYRIRRRDAPRIEDPRGLRLDWAAPPGDGMVARLGDARPAVRDRAVATLARAGDAAVPALRTALADPNVLVRSNALWALTRIGSPLAQAAARQGLLDLDPRIREVACQSAFVTGDRAAAEWLVAKLGDDAPAVQREAARALGRLREPRAVAALGGSAAVAADPVLAHAMVHALIEIAAPAETKRLLQAREPPTVRAALLALDQSSPGELEPAAVFAALGSPAGELAAAALDIAVRHPEWSANAAQFLASPSARGAGRDRVGRLLAAFLPTPAVRDWARGQILAAASSLLEPVTLLDAIAKSAANWDDAWHAFIIQQLGAADPAVVQAALRAAATHQARDFSPALRALAGDTTRPAALRVAAVQLAAGSERDLDRAAFALLLAPFTAASGAEARLQAAAALGRARLAAGQLRQLVEILGHASPMELPALLGAFLRGPAEPVLAARLLAALRDAPGRWGVPPQTLQQIFQRFPPPAYEDAAPLIREIMDQHIARDGRIAELELAAARGDASRGRAAFAAGAGACASCHRVGDVGAEVGPDLSQIGRIRTTRDLVEAISFPSASIARGYESFQLTLRDGAVLTGTIPRETADTLLVRTADGLERAIARASVAQVEPVAASLMPAGLDRALEPEVLADLVAYLKSRQ